MTTPTQRVLIPGVLSREGTNPSGLTVYHFHGLGYWEAPANIKLDYNALTGYLIFKWLLTGCRRRISRYTRDFSPEAITATIESLVTAVAEEGLLFGHTVRSNWLLSDLPCITERAAQKPVVSVFLPKALRTEDKSCIYIGSVSGVKSLESLIEEGKRVKSELRREFYRRFTIDVKRGTSITQHSPLRA